MKNVLVVDDSNFMRNTIKKMLIKNGYAVVGEAENGKQGIEKYKTLRPDIVTLDITMNEMTGLEALEEIMKFDKNAKVVMVSAMGQDAFMQRAITAGARGFIIKPFKEENVISALSQAN